MLLRISCRIYWQIFGSFFLFWPISATSRTFILTGLETQSSENPESVITIVLI